MRILSILNLLSIIIGKSILQLIIIKGQIYYRNQLFQYSFIHCLLKSLSAYRLGYTSFNKTVHYYKPF